MCIYAHSLGSLGCYLQAVPFFWHDLNLTACTDLRWNLPFPPPGPQICLEDVCCNVSTLLIALIWKMLEKKSAVQTDRHMLVAQTDASIKPLFTCSPNAPVVWWQCGDRHWMVWFSILAFTNLSPPVSRCFKKFRRGNVLVDCFKPELPEVCRFCVKVFMGFQSWHMLVKKWSARGTLAGSAIAEEF